MFKISYKRDGNAIYAFFSTRTSYGDYKGNWYWKLIEHFERIFSFIRSEVICNHVGKYT